MKVTERIRMMMAEKQKEGDDGRQEEDEWQKRRTNAGSDLTGGGGGSWYTGFPGCPFQELRVGCRLLRLSTGRVD